MLLAVPGPATATPLDAADIAVLRAVNQAHSPVADVAFGGLSNEVQLFLVPPVAGFAIQRGQWGLAAQSLEAEAVAGVGSLVLKHLTARPRPYVTYPDLRTPRGPEVLSSFPSGHAAVSFAGATAIALADPAWAAPAYGWAALVSYSRLYNGVHYPTDVLAGAALGVGSAFLANWAFNGLNQRLGIVPQSSAVTMPLTWSANF